MSSPGLEPGSVSTPVYSTYEVKKKQKETKNLDTSDHLKGQSLHVLCVNHEFA
jgi:hypothetical protein